MRLDKYLKLTRLIKRRTVAKELADREIFKVNGRIAKPSSNLKVGDILELSLGRHVLTVEVLNIVDHVKKEDATSLYKVISDETIETDN